MEPIRKIPHEVASLIPTPQLIVTKKSLKEFTMAINNLETQLLKCPKMGQTRGMKEHPAIFHYFYGACDFFACEYDGEELMFGYSILNGDLPNSEWGYMSRVEIINSRFLNIDYYFDEQSIEAALFKAYPRYFKKPLSLM